MKPHVRSLIANIDSPTFRGTWPIFMNLGDFEPPTDFRLFIVPGNSWTIAFEAPAWMLLAHPRDFPVWRHIPRWPELFNITPMGVGARPIAVPIATEECRCGATRQYGEITAVCSRVRGHKGRTPNYVDHVDDAKNIRWSDYIVVQGAVD